MGIRALVLLALLATTAHAEDEPPVRTPARAARVTPPKSAAVANTLSLGTTALGLGLMVSGDDGAVIGGAVVFFVGPTTGHWYAGNGLNAGLGLRVLGTGAMVYGLSQADLFSFGEDEDEDDNGGEAALVGGLALYGVGLLYELVTVSSAVADYNDAHQTAVAPIVLRGGAGLAVGGRF